MPHERRVEILIQLAGRVVGDIQQRYPFVRCPPRRHRHQSGGHCDRIQDSHSVKLPHFGPYRQLIQAQVGILHARCCTLDVPHAGYATLPACEG